MTGAFDATVRFRATKDGYVRFVLAQAFTVLWTLLLAWLIFGGMIVAGPAM